MSIGPAPAGVLEQVDDGRREHGSVVMHSASPVASEVRGERCHRRVSLLIVGQRERVLYVGFQPPDEAAVFAGTFVKVDISGDADVGAEEGAVVGTPPPQGTGYLSALDDGPCAVPVHE